MKVSSRGEVSEVEILITQAGGRARVSQRASAALMLQKNGKSPC